MEKILGQGAEAKIILDKNQVIKDRISKSYRIKVLDEKIRKLRTRSETRLMLRASRIINVPIPKEMQEVSKIEMPYIKGDKLSITLDKFPLSKQKAVLRKIGKDLSKLHDSDIIHGDLTTSNMILKDDKIFFIDFGLGFISHKLEDKAVDLHLLKQALEAKHFQHWQALWQEFEKNYNNSVESKKVLERLKAVEKRGRYKEKY
jgi:Kae1-associated kinase Bud32